MYTKYHPVLLLRIARMKHAVALMTLAPWPIQVYLVNNLTRISPCQPSPCFFFFFSHAPVAKWSEEPLVTRLCKWQHCRLT